MVDLGTVYLGTTYTDEFSGIRKTVDISKYAVNKVINSGIDIKKFRNLS